MMNNRVFGEFDGELGYDVLDERVMRASAGIMLLLAVVASINGFILQRYIVIPFLTGALALNFGIGLLTGAKYAPTVMLGRIFVRKQSRLPIGAVQKKFAWGLGLTLSLTIFSLSFLLLKDVSYFEPVCFLCMVCILFLYLETAFGICMGCKLYYLAIRLKLLKKPEIQPNCMGDACEID